MIIEVSSSFGKVIAKPMKLVDIHDVQPMADEESITNSEASAEESNQVSEDVGAACREAE